MDMQIWWTMKLKKIVAVLSKMQLGMIRNKGSYDGKCQFRESTGKRDIGTLVHFLKELTFTNVHHVSEIRKNLVFTNFLCKRGVKAVLEYEKFVKE